MKSWFPARIVPLAALALICAVVTANAQTTIPVQNAGFGPTGGKIPGKLDLNALDAPPTSITQQLGSSGWYGQSNATAVLNLGFRPAIEVDDSSSAGVGYINYFLGAGLSGLLGAEMPEADLWQPLGGWSLVANATYTLSADVDAGALLDVNALGSRGFGLGLTVGSTTTSVGTFVADTISAPSLLTLTLLGGTAQRLTMSFTTGSTPPTGNLGVAFFGGRGTQTLQVALLESYRVDNASLSYIAGVPEPSTPVILLSGMGMLFLTRQRKTSGVDRTQKSSVQ